MARINPTLLRRFREKQHMSLEDLSRCSGIDKGTIFRIENGKLSRNSERVIVKLAEKLKVEPEQLTAAEAEPESDWQDHVLFPRTKIALQISTESRNALSLVATRYNVKPLDIIEFAPLLFHIAAGESLKERADRLAKLRNVREALENLGDRFPHIGSRLVYDSQAEALETREGNSITARDIRGDLLDEGPDFIDARPPDYEEDEENPFVQHLRIRLRAIQADTSEDCIDEEAHICEDHIRRWSGYLGPSYEICHEEALAYFGGDQQAANGLISGRFSITEIPKALRTADMLAERVAWAQAKLEEISARAKDLFPLDIGDVP